MPVIIKNKGYLTEENSCFVMFTNYLNEHLCRLCKFPNERTFPSLSGRSFKPGRSLSFSAVKRSTHSKGAFIQAGALLQIITVIDFKPVLHFI